MMTFRINNFILIFLLYGTTTYGSESFLIKHINFEGLQRISIDTVNSKLPNILGNVIDSQNISNIIHSLFATKYFEDIHVLKNGSTLIIKVKECPIIVNISFYGNQSIKDELLKKNLKHSGIYIGNLLDRSKIFNIEKEITDFYYSIGKYNVSIKTVITSLPNNCVSLKLIFKEGVSTKVKKINIIGNHTFTTNELMLAFKTYDKTQLFDFIENYKYSRQKLSNFLNFLQNYYLDHGYACFSIDSIQLNLTLDKKFIFITINITEGNQYTLSSIKLNSNLITEQFRDIAKIIKIKSEEIYNGTKINKIESNIKKILGNYGYTYPSIHIQPDIDNLNKKIKLNININLGKRFYVRRIVFRGNNFSKDSLLRKELHQMEGTWLSLNLLNQDKERLYHLGYFEVVNADVKRVPDSQNQVDIIYKVKENNSGSFKFGIGYGTENGLNFNVGIQQDNFLGTGYLIGINGIKNDYQLYSEISIINPYFTNDKISLNERLFFNNFKADEVNLSSYTNKNYGFESSIGFPINEHSNLRLGIGYDHNDLTNIKPQVAIWRYINSINKKNIIKNNNKFIIDDFTFNYSWIYNKLNNNYFPTKGTFIDINNKITIPGIYNNFYRLYINTSSYFPIDVDQKWIILGRTSLGYGNGLGGKEMPFYENFYAGGVNTIRGFKSNNIGPKAVYYTNFEKNNHNINNEIVNNKNKLKKVYISNDSIGGNAIVIANLEFINPIPFINDKYINSMRTSFFLDAGVVWDTHWEKNKYFEVIDYSNPGNIRISVGISLQWLSPIGPLIFSYAKPLKKTIGDITEQFQFNIGRVW